MLAIKWYNHKLHTLPLKTKILTACFTFTSADLICQSMEIKYMKKEKIDWVRAVRQGSYCVIAATWLHYYTCWMMPTFFPLGTKYRLAKTVIYDSLIHMPMYVTGIFVYLDLMTGKNLFKTYPELLAKIKHTIINAWTFRPWVQYINFKYVPICWRVLYINAFGFLWNIYLSYVQNVKGKQLMEAKLQKQLEKQHKYD